MIRKSAIKKLAKTDALKAQSIIHFDASFMNDVKSFFYLFYLGVFKQVDRLDMGVKQIQKNSKDQKEQAMTIKKELLKHMLLLIKSNRDLHLIIQTCQENQNELRLENNEVKKLFKKFGWEGEINTLVNLQTPDFLFNYSRLNAFLNTVLTEEYQTLLTDNERDEECHLTRLQ